jgi:uncharacterized protein YbaA (DUF1428 family)
MLQIGRPGGQRAEPDSERPVTLRELLGKKLDLGVGSPPGGSSFGRNEQKEAAMSYVDGFVIPVPKAKIEAYKAFARKAAEVWEEHGALACVECIGDDVPHGQLTSFPRAVQAKDDEIVIFSWNVYRSRAERDAINAKVMADPRLKVLESDLPFDGKRLIFGGFEAFLGL